MIRVEAGMPTTRFCSVIGVPERTWRRHQARARQNRRAKGPWQQPARDRVRDAARRHALAHPAWGHRKVWAMCGHDGLLPGLLEQVRTGLARVPDGEPARRDHRHRARPTEAARLAEQPLHELAPRDADDNVEPLITSCAPPAAASYRSTPNGPGPTPSPAPTPDLPHSPRPEPGPPGPMSRTWSTGRTQGRRTPLSGVQSILHRDHQAWPKITVRPLRKIEANTVAGRCKC